MSSPQIPSIPSHVNTYSFSFARLPLRLQQILISFLSSPIQDKSRLIARCSQSMRLSHNNKPIWPWLPDIFYFTVSQYDYRRASMYFHNTADYHWIFAITRPSTLLQGQYCTAFTIPIQYHRHQATDGHFIFPSLIPHDFNTGHWVISITIGLHSHTGIAFQIGHHRLQITMDTTQQWSVTTQ